MSKSLNGHNGHNGHSDQQSLWDMEEEIRFHNGIRELHTKLTLAREQRDKLKDELAIAQSEVRDASARLMSFLDADLRALPLFEHAARNGQS